VLKKFKFNQYIHCRYHEINPMKIRPGDVVEAQVSFVAIPLKQQKYKVLVVLQAITLLDCSPLRVSQHSAKLRNANKRQNASIARRMNGGAEPRRASQSLKRKIGYEEDEEHNTREKLNKMHLD
jgi:hypothetical protein